jgi:hypothetical protein
MLSTSLTHMIEEHAEQLAHGLISDLQRNPNTPEYHKLSTSEIHQRVYDTYRNLGEWMSHEADSTVQARYSDLGRRRALEGVPLSEVVYALIQTKNHLFDYVRMKRVFDSALELYQLQELRWLVDNFFDKAIYNTVRAYEREAVHLVTPEAAH